LQKADLNLMETLGVKEVKKMEYICDWIYENRSKLHIKSYEKINFKDFNAL